MTTTRQMKFQLSVEGLEIEWTHDHHVGFAERFLKKWTELEYAGPARKRKLKYLGLSKFKVKRK